MTGLPRVAGGLVSAPGRLHRPEIDGLRALAVLPVMLFHAGFGWFSGGYVGVDVFFVISGFLITSIILDEQLAGRFSIVRFYERRARRILPALLAVMLACLPLAWWWMLPHELAAFGRSVIAVCAFVSNVLFWLTTGYFDLAAEEKPLLHTWSLGVEEQYYVVFPLLVWACWRLGLRRLMLVLAAIAVASFVGSELLLGGHASASFFLAPTRAWELLAGSLLAFASLKGPPGERLPRPLQQSMAMLGLALVMVPVFVFDAATPFPGRNALLPVIGTALILACGTPTTWVGRLLTMPAMLWVGLISYSAYLWHQPLFAYARLMSASHPPQWIFGALVLLSLVLAYGSWRFVEQPFRDPRRWSRKEIFTASAIGSAGFVGVGIALVLSQGVPQRFAPEVRPLLTTQSARVEGCPAVDRWLHVCRIGAPPGGAGAVALLGDSHAYALVPALNEALLREGRAGYVVHTACHPIPGLFDSREALTPERIAFCAEAAQRLRAFVDRPEIERLFIAIRWTSRLYPMQDRIDAPAFDNHEGGIEADLPFRRNLSVDANGRASDAMAPKADALQAYLRSLAAIKPLSIVYPVPEVGWTPARLSLIGLVRTGEVPPVISTSWQRMRERHAVATELLDGLELPKLRRVRPEAQLCDTLVRNRCVVQAGGVPYYADDDHLSIHGARLVVKELLLSAPEPAPAR